MTLNLFRSVFLPVVAFVFATQLGGCKEDPKAPLGPASSFVLFTTAPQPPGQSPKVVVLRDKGIQGVPAQVNAALIDGFAAEMLRTAFTTQQYVANLKTPVGSSASAMAWANDAVPFVIGNDLPQGPRVGATISGQWIGGAVERPKMVWIGLPDAFANDKSVVPLLAARIAKYIGLAVASDGVFSVHDHVLATAYEQAIEVVAREWRGTPSAAVVSTTKLTESAAALFSGVRENRFVLAPQKQLRPAAELLSDPKVAATIFYRWFQDKRMMKEVANDAFYLPMKNEYSPTGISLAAVLGPFRNLQMKVLGTWIAAVRAGAAPTNIADLVIAYGKLFPKEQASLIRLFVATTYGATVKAGGVSTLPQDAVNSLAELSALSDSVIAGKTPLVLSP